MSEKKWKWSGHWYRVRGSNMEVSEDGVKWTSGADICERFLSKLVKNSESGCLEFAGATGSGGHGYFSVGPRGANRMVHAHRFAWLMAGRPITPKKPCILHDCDNPPCCLIEHLYAGTRAENQSDMARRNRGRKGPLPFGVRVNRGRFAAQVKFGTKNYHLGTFDTIEEAAGVAAAAKASFYSTGKGA